MAVILHIAGSKGLCDGQVGISQHLLQFFNPVIQMILPWCNSCAFFEQLCKMGFAETCGFGRLFGAIGIFPAVFNVFLCLFYFIPAAVNSSVNQQRYNISHFLLIIRKRVMSWYTASTSRSRMPYLFAISSRGTLTSGKKTVLPWKAIFTAFICPDAIMKGSLNRLYLPTTSSGS